MSIRYIYVLLTGTNEDEAKFGQEMITILLPLNEHAVEWTNVPNMALNRVNIAPFAMILVPFESWDRSFPAASESSQTEIHWLDPKPYFGRLFIQRHLHSTGHRIAEY